MSTSKADASLQSPRVWVLDTQLRPGTYERLGDAYATAKRWGMRVGVLLVCSPNVDAKTLFAHGADHVSFAHGQGMQFQLAACEALFKVCPPQLVIAPGDVHGREWAAMLAATHHWQLASHALMINHHGAQSHITVLDETQRRSRRMLISTDEPMVMTLKDGVGESRMVDASRQGVVGLLEVSPPHEPVTNEGLIPADPATMDITEAPRLLAGGRGLGSAAGFDLLGQLANRLKAGLAASRAAVDAGWITRERQVGQTGKTVTPILYLAAGISGASHHLEGMSQAQHIIAINSDPQAPIFKVAQLGLVADLHQTIQQTLSALEPS